MKRGTLGLTIFVAASLAATALVWWRQELRQKDAAARAVATDPAVGAKRLGAFLQLPLSFELNQGQAPKEAEFLARGSAYNLFLTPRGSVLGLYKYVRWPNEADSKRGIRITERSDHGEFKQTLLAVELVGSNPAARATPLEKSSGKVNYYVGLDHKDWMEGISVYNKVKYESVYPGIDLVYYGNQRQVEHDYVVSPGGNPKAIKFAVEGAEKVEVDAKGNLVATADNNQIELHKPVIYQEENGARTEIEGGYVLEQGNLVSFRIADYDASKQLVIDPVLKYSTFLGAAGEDGAWALALDADGNIYVSGISNSVTPVHLRQDQTPKPFSPGRLVSTPSLTYPLKAPYLLDSAKRWNGSICCGGNDSGRVVVSKLNPNLVAADQLVYSTYIGSFAGTDGIHRTCPLLPTPGCSGDAHFARGWDEGFGIAAGSDGKAYVTGQTEGLDFPTTPDAIRPYHPGPRCGTATIDAAGNAHCGAAFNAYQDHPRDAFLSIFSPTGTLLYSTLIGGHGSDTGQSVAIVDRGPVENQGIWLVAEAQSVDFFYNNHTPVGGKLCTNPKGCGAMPRLVWPPTTGFPSVNSYQVELNQAPRTSRFLGPGVSMVGGVYPTTKPIKCTDPATGLQNDGLHGKGMACWRDTYVIRLNITGTTVLFSTLLGGSGDDAAYGIIVDPATGAAYLSGGADSTDFPTTAGAFQTCHNGNGGYPQDFDAPSSNPNGSPLDPTTGPAPSFQASNPPGYTGYIRTNRATPQVVVPGSVFPCNLSPSPQTWDFEGVRPPTQKWHPDDDAFIAKFDRTGHLLYSSYLGGSADDDSGNVANDYAGDFGRAIAIDATGNAYVTGFTKSSNPLVCPVPPPTDCNPERGYCGCDPKLMDGRRVAFPVTTTGFQTKLARDPRGECDPANTPIPPGFDPAIDRGPECVPPINRHHANAFLLKIDTTRPTTTPYGSTWVPKAKPAGLAPVVPGANSALLYSTYIGGTGNDEGYSVTVDFFGNAYVTGLGQSESWVTFPVASIPPSFPIKNPVSRGMGCTACGQHLNGITNGTPPGPSHPGYPQQFSDAFVTKIDTNAVGPLSLVWSTFLGGNSDEVGHGIVYLARDTPRFAGVVVGGLTNSDPQLPSLQGPSRAEDLRNTASLDLTSPDWPSPPMAANPAEEMFIAMIDESADPGGFPTITLDATPGPTPNSFVLKVVEPNFTGAVDVSVGPLPAGTTARFTPPSPFAPGQGQIVGAGTVTLTVRAATPGTININGKVGYLNGVTVGNLTLPVKTITVRAGGPPPDGSTPPHAGSGTAPPAGQPVAAGHQ
jgi:hypothetical protein